MGARNDNSPPFEPERSSDLKHVMTQLCDMAVVPTANYDICSESFVESFLIYLRKKLEGGDEARMAAGKIIGSLTQPFVFQYTAQSIKIDTPSPELITIPSNPSHISSPQSSTPSSGATVFYLHTQLPTATDILQNGDGKNSSNVTSTSASSPPLCVIPATDTIPTPVPSALDIISIGTAPPLTSNKAQVDISDIVEDNFLEELIGIPLPSCKFKCEQCPDKFYTLPSFKRHMKKIHEVVDSSDKFYRCTCGSKKSKGAQKHHINAQWKFKCERCTKKFYDLTTLKYHLKKEHGVENPLKGYKIGCTLCEMKCKIRIEFSKHKILNHNIHKVPERESRRQSMSSKQSGFPPGNPMPRLSPRNLDSEWGMQGQNEVIDLISIDDEEDQDINEGEGDATLRQWEQQQPLSVSLMNGNQEESGNFSVETSPGLNVHNGHSNYYEECYGGIMCNQAFRDLQQLRRHLQQRHQSDLRGKADRKEDLAFVCRYYCREDKMTVGFTPVFFCVTCGSSPFPYDVTQLREHMSLKHTSKCEIWCATCKVNFGSCESYDRHWNQCSKSY